MLINQKQAFCVNGSNSLSFSISIRFSVCEMSNTTSYADDCDVVSEEMLCLSRDGIECVYATRSSKHNLNTN